MQRRRKTGEKPTVPAAHYDGAKENGGNMVYRRSKTQRADDRETDGDESN